MIELWVKSITLEDYKMEKYIYNEKNGLWYELQGDYYLPCLKLPEDGTVHIGIWGQRHLRHIRSAAMEMFQTI